MSWLNLQDVQGKGQGKRKGNRYLLVRLIGLVRVTGRVRRGLMESYLVDAISNSPLSFLPHLFTLRQPLDSNIDLRAYTFTVKAEG